MKWVLTPCYCSSLWNTEATSPNSSYPATMQFHSSILVEAALLSYWLNMQCLLDKELQCLLDKKLLCLLAWSTTWVTFHSTEWSCLVACSLMAAFSRCHWLQASLCSCNLQSSHQMVFWGYTCQHEQGTWRICTTTDRFSNGSGSFTWALLSYLFTNTCHTRDSGSGLVCSVLFSLVMLLTGTVALLRNCLR